MSGFLDAAVAGDVPMTTFDREEGLNVAAVKVLQNLRVLSHWTDGLKRMNEYVYRYLTKPFHPKDGLVHIMGSAIDGIPDGIQYYAAFYGLSKLHELVESNANEPAMAVHVLQLLKTISYNLQSQESYTESRSLSVDTNVYATKLSFELDGTTLKITINHPNTQDLVVHYTVKDKQEKNRLEKYIAGRNTYNILWTVLYGAPTRLSVPAASPGLAYAKHVASMYAKIVTTYGNDRKPIPAARDIDPEDTKERANYHWYRAYNAANKHSMQIREAAERVLDRYNPEHFYELATIKFNPFADMKPRLLDVIANEAKTKVKVLNTSVQSKVDSQLRAYQRATTDDGRRQARVNLIVALSGDTSVLGMDPIPPMYSRSKDNANDLFAPIWTDGPASEFLFAY